METFIYCLLGFAIVGLFMLIYTVRSLNKNETLKDMSDIDMENEAFL